MHMTEHRACTPQPASTSARSLSATARARAHAPATLPATAQTRAFGSDDGDAVGWRRVRRAVQGPTGASAINRGLFWCVVAMGVCVSQCDDTYDTKNCPRGKYRSSTSGQRHGECISCPRGRYGETEGLTTASCTSKCPMGKYNDRLGARTEDDCFYCPPGRYGSSEGLKTEDCSGWCPSGTYNSLYGLTTADDCIDCPTGYRGWQCEGDGHHFRVTQTPRRGKYSSTDGTIDERSHAYIQQGMATVPQGKTQVTFNHFYTPLENMDITESS